MSASTSVVRYAVCVRVRIPELKFLSELPSVPSGRYATKCCVTSHDTLTGFFAKSFGNLPGFEHRRVVHGTPKNFSEELYHISHTFLVRVPRTGKI